MKNAILTIGVFLIVLPLFSQKDEFKYSSMYVFIYTSPSDSTPSSIEELRYDEFGNTVLRTSYSWNSYKKIWQGSGKEEYKWNNNHKQTELIHSSFNYETGRWYPEWKMENSYDNKDNILSMAEYWWNSSLNEWEGYYKFEYIRNQAGKINEECDYNWKNSWVPWYKTTIEFDQNGNDIFNTSTKWNGQTWQKDLKGNKTYNQAGKIISDSVFVWNDTTSNWVLFSSTVNRYDEKQQLVIVTRFEWPDQNHEGTGTFRKENAYDDAGNIILTTTFLWNNDSSVWEQKYRATYSFDSRKNMLGERHLTLDDTAAVWRLFSENNYTYNLDNRWTSTYFSYVITPDYSKYWSGKSDYFRDKNGRLDYVVSYGYDQGEDSWSLSMKTYYIYSKSAVIYSSDTISVFPNPFTDLINIGIQTGQEYLSSEISDLNGRVVVTSTEKIINLAHLGKGVYILRLRDRNGQVIKTQRLLKK